MTQKTIYLDFNATYPPDNDTIMEMAKWAKKGNISANYTSAEDGKALLTLFKKDIAALCEFSLNGPNGYTIVFTSGASESNSFIIQSACRAFIKAKKVKPHVISSAVEHDSILYCLEGLEEEYLQYDLLNVHREGNLYGTVDVRNLSKLIRQNTCLISIMSSNNETGAINDLKSICTIAKSKGIPVHTDAVQLFSKEIFKPNTYGVDAFSVSFHKFGGPIGCGCIAIRNSLLTGYKLPPLIYGSQQDSLRGGTIPIHNLAAARVAFNKYFNNRMVKTIQQRNLKEKLIGKLAEIYPVHYISQYLLQRPPPPAIILLMSPDPLLYMSNTLLLAVYKIDICNVELRKKLYEHKVIVSIGSACKTSSKKVSHVITELNVPDELRAGIFRISLGDCTTEEDIDTFVYIFGKLLLQE